MRKAYVEPTVDEVALTQEEGISCGGSSDGEKKESAKPAKVTTGRKRHTGGGGGGSGHKPGKGGRH